MGWFDNKDDEYRTTRGTEQHMQQAERISNAARRARNAGDRNAEHSLLSELAELVGWAWQDKQNKD